MRTTMEAVNIPHGKRYKLAKDFASFLTKTDGLMVLTSYNKVNTRYEHFGGSKPGFSRHLCTLGEAGIVALKNIGTSKVEPQGEMCMLINYVPDHTANTYRIWDPVTNNVYTTWDVTWLHQMYYTTLAKTQWGIIEQDFYVQAVDNHIDSINSQLALEVRESADRD